MSRILWYNIPNKYLEEKELFNYLLDYQLRYKYLNFKYCVKKSNQYLPKELWTLILYELCYDVITIQIKDIIDWFNTFIQNKSQHLINPLYITTQYENSYILSNYDIAYTLLTKNLINNSLIISDQFDLFFAIIKDSRILGFKIYIRDELFYQSDLTEIFEFNLDNIINIDNFVNIDPKKYPIGELSNIINLNIKNLSKYIFIKQYNKNYEKYTFYTLLDILPILKLRLPHWEVKLELISDVNIDQITLLYGKLRYELAEELKNITLLETDKLRYKYYSLKRTL